MTSKKKTFESWRSYSLFEIEIKRKRRYFRSDKVEKFCETVLNTSSDRMVNYSKGDVLWRSQIGHGWRYENSLDDEVPAPHEPKRMSPRHGRANEGRANSKGIPCLYLASNKTTAIAEARPWVGSFVSVGQFKILRELKIINCTTEKKGYKMYFHEPSPEERKKAVWSAIDKSFSLPVNPSDDVADYVPTQVIAELFKSKGFDGIGYRSALGDGFNIALFDIDSAEIINCFLYAVKKIDFDFSEISNPYFLQRHYKGEKSKANEQK
jgi:RES domain